METFEKKYKEALDKAKYWHKEGWGRGCQELVEDIFPELVESEDEKVRKAIIELVRQSSEILGMQNQSNMLVWLEKQGTSYTKRDVDDAYLKGVSDTKHELEKQGEKDRFIKEEIECIKGYRKNAIKKLEELEKQGTPAKLSEEEQNRFAKCVLSSCAMSFIDYLDAHKYEGKMCVSNGECEDIENAFHNAMWDRLHRYYCKYIEKQGEKLPVGFYYVNSEGKKFYSDTFKYGDVILHVEKQGKQILSNSSNNGKDEQKPDDKVEPKFQNGQWIVWQNKCYKVNYNGCGYELIDQNGLSTSLEYGTVDKSAHLWTIQDDAKDGDVLHSTGWHNDCIFVFKGLDNWKFDEPNGDRAVATGYCCLSVSADNMEFGIQGPDCVEVNTIKPATKIQRDLLYRKMHEAGYAFDFENKELKKIDVNHEYFSELLENDDSKDINHYAYQVAYCMSHDWQKDTATWDDVERACKLGAEWNERHRKHAWGEEDEKIALSIEQVMNCASLLNIVPDKVEKVRTWLKSLKQRIGG